MQKHTKNYLKHHDYCKEDIILCEVCGTQAVDIHHKIHRSQGGSDEVENLVALCRKDHEAAHRGEIQFNNKKK